MLYGPKDWATKLRMNSSEKRANLLMWCSAQLDYWTPRKDSCREAEEQHDYYTNMMKFLVTQYDTAPMREVQSGAPLVFPSL